VILVARLAEHYFHPFSLTPPQSFSFFHPIIAVSLRTPLLAIAFNSPVRTVKFHCIPITATLAACFCSPVIISLFFPSLMQIATHLLLS